MRDQRISWPFLKIISNSKHQFNNKSLIFNNFFWVVLNGFLAELATTFSFKMLWLCSTWTYFWCFGFFPSFLVEYYLYTSTINLFVDILKCTVLCSYIWNMGPSFLGKLFYICMSDILFRQITTFMKVCVAFVFGTSIDFTLKNGLEPKKQRPHKLLWMLWFDEKIYLMYIHISILNIENFLEKPDGAKNHDGQKSK